MTALHRVGRSVIPVARQPSVIGEAPWQRQLLARPDLPILQSVNTSF